MGYLHIPDLSLLIHHPRMSVPYPEDEVFYKHMQCFPVLEAEHADSPVS